MNTTRLEKRSNITNHVGGRGSQALTNPVEHSETDSSPLLGLLIVIWLAGTVVLLPVKLVNLPSNFELVDIWILMGLPIVLLFYSFERLQIINLSYAVPMWFVLVSSFLSTFIAPVTEKGIVIIFKETYLFLWFIAVTVFLCTLSAKNMRRVLYIWSGVVILHGLLMIAQFLSPDIWQFTNSLGGNTARLEGYRAAGMFICDKAGCANKAAFFQLLGFVPLLLAGFPKKITAFLSAFLFISMLTAGSMGATLAFLSGLICAVIVIAFLKKNLFLAVKYFLTFTFVTVLIGGAFFIATSQNQNYLNHFEKIIVGRYERSSEGRFSLWQRGIDALVERNAYFWGVGPDNFRVVDAAQTDNQLHNDALAFLVERGLIGLVGLILFVGIALRSAIRILQISNKSPERARMELVVFLAVIVATMVESLTHQLFRTRELWLVLAVQEAVLYKMIISEYGLKSIIQVKNDASQHRHGVFARSDSPVDG
jgi:O-antigen ligase